MLSLLALMIGTSVFVPTAQAFQEEEPAAAEQVVAAEESTTEMEEVGSLDSEAESTADEPAYYDKAESNYITNTLFMMVCAVLVILMQPGFALREVGLNAKKNTVNILFKNVMDLS